MIKSGLGLIDVQGGLISGKVYPIFGDKKTGKTTILSCIHHNCGCSIVCNDTNEYETPLALNLDRFKPEYNTDFICKWNKVISKIELMLESDKKPTLIIDIKKDVLTDSIDIAKKYNIPVLISIDSKSSIPFNILEDIIEINKCKGNEFSRIVSFKDKSEIIKFDLSSNSLISNLEYIN